MPASGGAPGGAQLQRATQSATEQLPPRHDVTPAPSVQPALPARYAAGQLTASRKKLQTASYVAQASTVSAAGAEAFVGS